MKPHPIDLRQRIVNAVEKQLGTIAEIAEMFGINERYIYKLLARWRKTGSVAPLPHGGGVEAKLKEEHLMKLTDLVAEHPDATLEELRQRLSKQTQIDLSLTTVWRGLDALGLTLKKKSKRASEADQKERAAFKKRQPSLPAERFVLIDEYGVHLAMSRSHARAPKGERAEVTEPFNPGPKLSVISALGLTGEKATMMIEGSIDSEVFDLYIEHFLAPHLRPGDWVWLDNIRFHYSPRAIELIEARGAKVEHFPAYSPDFNPIEEFISKIKALLRKAKADTERKLRRALAKAIASVTRQDIIGWFRDCGYTCPSD